MRASYWILALGLLATYLLVWFAVGSSPPFLDSRDLDALEIYAYKDWQGTSILVEQGDVVAIQAWGEWLYTPGEWHGPAGHARYLSPSFYPLPGVPGGALIGRIGEQGSVFLVGKRVKLQAPATGQLYLRIDDDILSDNEGKVQVNITVAHPATPAPTTAPPPRP